MSIQQIQSALSVPRSTSSLAAHTAKTTPASTFSAAMDSAAQKHNLKPGEAIHAATAAAELLKLDMMKSALSLGGESSSPTFTPLNIPLKLTLADIMPARQKVDADTTIPPLQADPVTVENKPHRATENVQDIVNRASEKYGVDEALIKAVIKAESNFNPSAVSHAGAQGLMQLMPSTARGLGVQDSFNPEQNVMAGTRFLKDMINRYHGNVDSALAAYNWGPGNVDRKGTGSLPQETREYLAKVKSYYNQYVG